MGNFKLSLSANKIVGKASEILKRKYIQTIGQQNLKSIHTRYRSKKRFYVELAMASKDSSLDENTFENEKRSGTEETITIDQLLKWNEENNLMLIQGWFLNLFFCDLSSFLKLFFRA